MLRLAAQSGFCAVTHLRGIKLGPYILHQFEPLSENQRDDGHPEAGIVLELSAVGFVLPFGPDSHLN